MRRFGTILAAPFWSGALAAVVAQQPAAIADRAMVPAGGASLDLQFSPDGSLLASGIDAVASGIVVDRTRRIALATLPDRVLVLRFDFGAESR